MDSKYTSVPTAELTSVNSDSTNTDSHFDSRESNAHKPVAEHKPRQIHHYASVSGEEYEEGDRYASIEDKHPGPAMRASNVNHYSGPLPIDTGTHTKLECLVTILFSVLSGLICVVISISYWAGSRHKRGPHVLRALPNGLPGEALSIIVNIILTHCLEGLFYTHSISLRWALLKERRLTYNTNLRLFTSSKLSPPNSWYSNLISACLLILSYGCTSVLVIPLVQVGDGTFSGSYINLVALLILGLALLGQSALALWCYYGNLRDIPSWNANALSTTAIMLNENIVQHRPGRCLQPVQMSGSKDVTPTRPLKRQANPWKVKHSVKKSAIFTWCLAFLAVIWFLTIVLIARSNMLSAISRVEEMSGQKLKNATWHFEMDWNPVASTAVHSITDTSFFNAVLFSLDPAERGGYGASMSLPTALFVGLLFVSAIQSFQTLGLHCAELIINMSRDEEVWRSLDAHGRWTSRGSIMSKSPALAAVLSWKYDMLAIFKSLLHWLLGQAVQPAFAYEGGVGDTNMWFTMNYARLLVYVICAIVFTAGVTYLTFARPSGPQPATYGHIQTMADLVDDWTLGKDERFWWGDKGGSDEVRHAGTNPNKANLGVIQLEAAYAGCTKSCPNDI